KESKEFKASEPLDHSLTHTSPTRALSYHMTARMAMRVQPAMSPGLSARVAKVMALSDSDFRKSLDSNDEGPNAGDGGHDSNREEEEVVSKGQQQAASVMHTAEGQGSRSIPDPEGASKVSAFRQPTLTTWIDPEDGRDYIDIPVYAPPTEPIQTPPSPEWSSGSLPISLENSSVLTPAASPAISTLVTSPAMMEAESFMVELGAQVEELFTRSGAVRDEIFSQRYRFRSLKWEQERTAVTFGAIWRPMLALELWVGRTDDKRAAMWRAIYDIQ
ncbi:hypothetical protein Tco_0630041, partial [Tanacetum coccineum]